MQKKNNWCFSYFFEAHGTYADNLHSHTQIHVRGENVSVHDCCLPVRRNAHFFSSVMSNTLNLAQ